jgi:hypothetical protein
MDLPGSHSSRPKGGDGVPGIYSYLDPSEQLLSVFGPFFATSYRVLRLDPPRGPSRGHVLEIPYHQLTSIELVNRPNHPVLALGTVVIILGLFLSLILFFSTFLVLALGAVMLYLGMRGKPGYFQLYAQDMPRKAQRYWQVEYKRSGNFIATVRSAIGQMPDF